MAFQQRRFSPLVSTPADATEVAVDQTQAVSGTRGVRAQAGRWQSALLVAGLLYFQPASSGADVLGPQPDTWTQDVQGTASVGLKARAWARTAAGMGRLWQAADGQPETWTQPIAGTAALAQQATQWRTRVGQTARYWTSNDEPAAVVVTDPWTQPTSGTSALATAQRAFTARAQLASSLLWQESETTSAPLDVQADTWPQPVAGVGAISLGRALFTGRAVQTALYWNPAQDPPPQAFVDQWTQAVAGTAALRTGQLVDWARAVQASALYWQTSEDSSAPLGVQPDTWVQPVQGTAAIAAGQRAWRTRVQFARALAGGAVVVIPPVPGTGAPRLILVDGRLAIHLSGLIYEWVN